MLLFVLFLRRTSKSPILLPEYHQFHFPEEQTSCCSYFLCSILVQEQVAFHFLQFDAFWLKCNRNSYSSTVRTDLSGTNTLVKHLQGAERCINGYTVTVTAIINQMQCIYTHHYPLQSGCISTFETLYKCLDGNGVLLTLCGFPLFTVSLIQSKFLWIVNHFEFLQKCFDHFMCSCFTKTKQWLLNYQQIRQTSTFLDRNKIIKQSAWPKPQNLPNHQHITQFRLFVEKFTIPYL